MRLVYVTSRYPFGQVEAFLGPEIAAHVDAGWPVSIFPAYPRGRVVREDASALLGRVSAPGAGRSAVALAASLVSQPRTRRSLGSALRARQPARIRVKNAAVLSRVGALVSHLQRVDAEHVHVHWGGTSSTLAMAAADAVGIPWSMTLHRWDIYEDNLLAEKIDAATFTRVISSAAADDVRKIVPSADPLVLHMGVEVPAAVSARAVNGACRLVCVASLVPVKDHASLVSAFAELRDVDATLELVGTGPREQALRDCVSELGLERRVTFAGHLDHRELLDRLRSRCWDGIVLTSSAGATEHEGIPVSLMEAMAAGLPALATDSGATGELVGDGAGIVVPAGDTPALAVALRRFATDPELRSRLSIAGRRRVEAEFDVAKIAQELRELFTAGAAT